MLLNTKTKLVDLKGEIIKDGEKDLTVGVFLAGTLAYTPNDKPLLSWDLANKLTNNDEVELSSDDIVFIKSVMIKATNLIPLSVGQAINILEGKAKVE